MTHYHVIAAAALVLTIGTARANDLKPIQAQSVHLGGVSGTAYYTVEPDGFHVITTLAQDSGDRTPVRIHTVLVPGQRVIISTPGTVGVEPTMISIGRQGDNVVVQHSPLSN
ncbi:hypothetical protein BB934_41355 (plasmid) [Microvirga ossetica]|uniref:Uncharacterized protein n=2 Tax=Microvirga ossetica TaxID=1882682 RepID=A0A1B2EXW3_9HYPH|nr:hypothetical protein BB934_41355 [Microvirga ossetica]